MPNYPLTPVFPEFEEVFEWLTEREIALIQFERVNNNFDYFISRCQGNINLLVINKNFINELLENVPPLRWMPWLDIFLIDLIDCYNIKKFLNSIPWPYVRKWRYTKKWRLIKEFKNMKSALYMEPIVSKEYPDYLIGVFNDFKIKLLEEYDKIMTLQEEKNRTKQKVEKTLKPKPEKQWSYELKNIEYLNKTDPEDEIKYFFWQVWERVSNISQKNIIKRHILELEKILEDLEKYFSMELTEGTLLELKDLEKKTKELIEIWKNIEKKEVEENIIQNQEVAENREEVVKENFAKNNIHENFEVIIGNLVNNINEKYDIIVSNILVDVLTELLEDIEKVLLKDSVIIFSGILKEKEEMFLEKTKLYKLEQIDRNEKNNWVSLVFRYKGELLW